MEISPQRSVNLTLDEQDVDGVCEMIEEKVKKLVDVLKLRNDAHATALNDIMWRELFHLPPEAAVDIVITGAEDSNDSANTM